MPLADRHRARLRAALEAVLRAEDAVAEVAAAAARTGDPATDATLDTAAEHLHGAAGALVQLLAGD